MPKTVTYSTALNIPDGTDPILVAKIKKVKADLDMCIAEYQKSVEIVLRMEKKLSALQFPKQPLTKEEQITKAKLTADVRTAHKMMETRNPQQDLATQQEILVSLLDEAERQQRQKRPSIS